MATNGKRKRKRDFVSVTLDRTHIAMVDSYVDVQLKKIGLDFDLFGFEKRSRRAIVDARRNAIHRAIDEFIERAADDSKDEPEIKPGHTAP